MAWGRVVLLLAAAEATKVHLVDVAKTMDYSAIPKSPEKQQDDVAFTGGELDDEALAANHEVQHFPEMVFGKITQITTFKPAKNEIPAYLSDTQKAAEFEQHKQGTFIFEAPKPLATLSQLTPLLINSLGRKVKGKQLNYTKVVRCVSQGKAVKKLFYRQQHKWPLQLTILLDKHEELFPYWADFDHIVTQLQIQLGECNVQVLAIHERNLYDFIAQQNSIHPAILILSDLQSYDNQHRYWAWQDILERLQKQATTILTLSSASTSPASAVCTRKARVNSLIPRHGFIRHAKKHGFTMPVSEAQLEAALTMISPLAMVDGGLLRKLRHTFNWGSPVLEGQLWNDKRIVQSVLGIRLQATEQEKYRAQFSQLDESIQQQFWQLVESHHKDAYPGLLNLERTSKMALSHTTEADQAQTIAYLQSLLAHYQQNANSSESAPLQAQLRTFINFAPQAGWHSSEVLSDLLHQAYALAYQDEIRHGQWSSSLPAQLDPNKISLPESTMQSFSVQVSDLHGEVIVSQGSTDKAKTLFKFNASATQPALWQRSATEPQMPIKNKQRISLKKNQSLMIKTAKQQWQIKCITCPDFAQNIGQDQRGLFIETELNNSDKRYYWLPEQVDEQGQKQAGAWFPERQVGENIGRDQYGLYRDVSINKIMQRFRYIQPGCFLMGSPEGELERELWDGKETQHQVTLTEGFWLADTAVTQALYQAVMSENLRRFKNDLNHPVEQVSWDNVQQFIKKLKTIMPALHAQLPTEAQWEYACRAGTLTPFSFGDNISLEQVNYDGKGPYAEGKKGKKRNKTVVVKSLLENAWGLYEMHGNVWEWCTDKHQEDLGDAATIDPIGGEDGSFRVLRGGSWFSSGGSTRSAYRRRLQPDERYFRIGFRLVLGHQFQTEKEKGS